MTFIRGPKDVPESNPPIPEEENAVLERVALKVIHWRMAVPAIVFLESAKPLNYIGAQVMVFFEPIVQSIFNFKDYEVFRTALERRENIENLLQKIEKYDAIMYEREKDIRRFIKSEKKNWTWYQKYLGIKRPRIVLPENLRQSPFESKGSQC